MFSFRLHILPAILVVLVLGLAALAVAKGETLPRAESAEPPQLATLAFTDVMPSGERSRPDVVIAHVTPPIRGAAPRADTPARTDVLPEWVRTAKATALLSLSLNDLDARGDGTLPPETYLKVLDAQNGSWFVLYGGDGRDRVPVEGWVAQGDAVASAPPPWVVTRRATDLRTAPGGAGSRLVSLPVGALLEVTGDLGQELSVFHHGDGLTREAAEGWVDSSHVGPAGIVLNAEREVRLFPSAGVAAVLNGDATWINVPFRSQVDSTPAALANCGPASLAMALSAFDQFLPTSEVRGVAEQLQGTNDPDLGFRIEFLAGSVSSLGLTPLDLREGGNLKRWSLEDARRHISAGHPVIPELRFKFMPGRSDSEYGEDHYIVLTGTWGDDFIYNDPMDLDGPGYARLIDAEALELAWSWSFAPYAAFAVSGP